MLIPCARSVSRVSSYAFAFDRVRHCHRISALSGRARGKISSQRVSVLPHVSRFFSAGSLHRIPIATPPTQDPYSYTDGRWLHQDVLQRKARYVQFDFSGLCEIAIRLSEGRLVSPVMKRRKGDITESLSCPWIRASVLLREYQRGLPDHLD